MSSTCEFTFREAAIGDGFRLDPEAGIAYGVAVCGPVSANGRDYPDAVRDRDKGVYESAPVYIDHADGERRVREWFGELRNPRTRISDRRTIADHHYPKNSAFTAEYEERAKKFPRSLGFSHVAVCSTKRVNGREVIEAIRRVESVDLVARPATNSGITESHKGKPMTEEEMTTKVAEAEGKVNAAEKQVATLTEQVKTLTAERDKALTENAGLKLDKELAEAGLTGLTAEEREPFALLAEGKRGPLIETYKKARQGSQSQPPKSGEQNGQRNGTTNTTTGGIPTDGKAFAESLKRK